MCSRYQTAATNGQRHGSHFSEAAWAAAYEQGCAGDSAETPDKWGRFGLLALMKTELATLIKNFSVSSLFLS